MENKVNEKISTEINLGTDAVTRAREKRKFNGE